MSSKVSIEARHLRSPLERLIDTIQSLSLTRSLEGLMEIVRGAARQLVHSDGATFVLKEGSYCHYADEDAISPLWKGRRFPMDICISGWAMKHAEPVIIENIYVDPRIPLEAYRPTFVKSLAIVPIRKSDPIGAIGTYWASHYRPTPAEISLLSALADSTAVAMENLRLYREADEKLLFLDKANYELSRFAWVASHDMREPLRTIVAYSELVKQESFDRMSESEREHLQVIADSATRLQALTDGLLNIVRMENTTLKLEKTDLASLVDEVLKVLKLEIEASSAKIVVDKLPKALVDQTVMKQIFTSLLTNAIKFRQPSRPLQITMTKTENDFEWIFCIRDNGVGIPPEYHQKIFGFFERLYSKDVYPGTGLGLALCRRAIELHGGKIWIESNEGEGSSFFFTLPKVSAESKASVELLK